MAEFQVEGKNLKKLLKLGERHPISFAFAPGTSDPNHYLAMHRNKPPEVVGRSAKRATDAAKVAYGTLRSDGLTIELHCEQLVDSLGKKMRQHLKDERIALKVIVLDPEGNPVGGVDPEEAEDAAAAPAPDSERDALVGRATALKARITSMQGPVADKLTKALAAAVKLIRDGDLAKADGTLTTVEAAVAKVIDLDG